MVDFSSSSRGIYVEPNFYDQNYKSIITVKIFIHVSSLFQLTLDRVILMD